MIFPWFLTLSRFALAPVLVVCAWRRAGMPFCALLVASLGMDIADGVLARRWLNPAALARQRRWDGGADAVLYGIAPLCLWRLRPGLPRAQAMPLVLLLLAHLLDLAAGLAKFRRLPRYHTRSFRISAGALGLAVPTLFTHGDRAAPFEFALWAATAAHIENILITHSLTYWRASVPTLRDARR